MPTLAKNATQLLFQNTLAEVVRKLRASTRRNEADAIEQYVKETKDEVASPVQSVKVEAVQKAVYFHMLGYSAAYANFNIVEVMADTAFAYKRIAYVAACTVFSEDTDVLPLLTALLKRDLGSGNQYEAGLALYCIASICTPHLARELVVDVVNLLQHPRTYVRKKAVLSLYKIFLQYPDALRPTYPRLKEKLEDGSEHSDPDPAVRGAVVCVLCELARRNPANFLGLSVPFYSLLSSVHSNWTLIKIVKVFGYFAPLEPRLGKKLVEPLTTLILSTSAKSVQYECLLAVANGMSTVPALTKLAADKLRLFVTDTDQNLKFLGLEAMSRLAVDNAKLLGNQRDVILACLGDCDVTIRCKALSLLRALVTRDNLVATVNHILDLCAQGTPQTAVDDAWLNTVVRTTVEMAQTDDYGLVDDFEWYLGVLADLSVLEIATYAHGRLVEREFVTILFRVSGVRQYGVGQLAQLLGDERVRKHATPPSLSTQWHILSAAAFACGEYPHWLPDKRHVCALLSAEAIALLPAEAQLACVAALSKIVAYVDHPSTRHLQLCDGEEDGTPPVDVVTLEALRDVLRPCVPDGTAAASPPTGLAALCRSIHPDVQERACLVCAQLADGGGAELYAKELPPVAAGAQSVLELPDGLDLDTPFCDDLDALTLALTASDADDEDDGANEDGDFSLEYQIALQRKLEKERMAEVMPFYLKPTSMDDARSTTPGDEPDARPRPRHTHRTDRTGKTFVLKKDLQAPAAVAKVVAAARAVEVEEDEATRKLRHIDVTRALTADEKLPETRTYAAILATGATQGSGVVRDGAPEPAPAAAPPVTLHESSTLRVVLYVEGCKMGKKDAVALRCALHVTNLMTHGALQAVRLGCESDAAVEGGGGTGEANLVLENDDEDGTSCGGGAREGQLLVADAMRASELRRKTFVLRLREWPAAVLRPLPLVLHYHKEHKRRHVALPFALRYVYLCKQPASRSMTAELFRRDVLGDALRDAHSTSVFAPCLKASVVAAVARVQRQLRLLPMDVFRDAMSLYGVTHGRRSAPAHTHVAMLLREAEQEGVKGVAITARAHFIGVAHLVARDIQDILQNAEA